MEREWIRIAAFLGGLLVSVGAALLITWLVRMLACRNGWYDKPDERKVHRNPTPRLGGIGIVCGFFAGLGAFALIQWFFAGAVPFIQFPATNVILAALIMALCGFVDDTAGYRPFQKFFCQVCVTLMMIFEGFRFHVGFLPETIVGIPGDYFSIALTFFWILGIINAVNLIDGLDGLAAGVSLIVVSSLTIAVAAGGHGPDLVFAASFVGAIFGFLAFNFHPARIFMGDTGSLFLGFMLAVYALPVTNQSDKAFAFLIPVAALGLPILDTSTAFIRRMMQGKSPFAADKEHIHHRLSRLLGLSHRGTVLALYVLSGAFGVTSICFSVTHRTISGLGMAAFAAIVLLVLLRLRYVRTPGDFDLALTALLHSVRSREKDLRWHARFNAAWQRLRAERRGQAHLKEQF